MNNSPRLSLSIFSANLLYLTIIILTITIGSLIQTWNFTGGLIASELLLYLLPAIVFLRLRRIPLNEGLRLKPIHPLIGLLCVLLGFSTFLFTNVLDKSLSQIGGLSSIRFPAGSIPTGIIGFVGYFLAVAVFAPLCEEATFRGAIQGAYEKRYAASVAIITVALLFALWHMRLSGLTGLLLAAVIFGFVAWRSGSILASILVHFGLNALAAINTLLSLSNRGGLPFLGLPTAAGGLVVTLGLIYGIWRLQPAVERTALPEPGQRRSWLRDYWPLGAAGLIFVLVAGSTIMSTFISGQITLKQAGYNEVSITKALESHYRITDQAGDEVGQMTCTIEPLQANIHLDCTSQVKAYEVTFGGSNHKDEAHTTTWSATWDPNTMDLLTFTYERSYENTASNFRAIIQDGQLVVDDSKGTQTISLSPDTLVEYEWAWRANALKPQVVKSIQAPFVYLSLWDEETQKSSPTFRNEILHIYSSQPLTLPAGQFQAYKSELGGQSAWYTSGHAGPIRFEDGMLIYELND